MGKSDFDENVLVPKILECIQERKFYGENTTIFDVKRYLATKGIFARLEKLLYLMSENHEIINKQIESIKKRR